MDIRIRKTKQSIYNAFIDLRSKMPLEKITVKDLCSQAQINKSTFYVYYKDIYDLSDQIENEIVGSVVKRFRDNIADPKNIAVLLCETYSADQERISVVFSGSRKEQLPRKIESAIKETFFEVYPQFRNDFQMNARLTFCIYGGYYAYDEVRRTGQHDLIGEIGSMSAKIFDK